jgi:hypothetical protein
MIKICMMLIVLASGCASNRCGACCDEGFAAMVPGLLQKIYGRDPETGEFCGIYIFELQAALEASQETELARDEPRGVPG